MTADRTALLRWITLAQLAAIDGDDTATEEALFRAMRAHEQIRHDATALDRLLVRASTGLVAFTERRTG